MDRSLALPLPRPLRLARPLRPRRALVVGVLAALLAAPALYGAWLWLRDSPLVSVERVRVSGVHGPYASGIATALDEAARHMSTLDVHVGQLRAAVASYRVVRDLRVSASFPHTLRIAVIEQPPVAALSVGGVRTAVAADGAILGTSYPGLASSSLPTVPGGAGDPLAGGRVNSAAARAAVAVLGAAPPTLLGWIARAYQGRQGLTVAMRNGLLLYFGDATRPHAKWLSAARVLADPSSAGAWYVDVRLPERPAAGIAGTATSAAPGSEGSGETATRVSASDPTAAALAATLAEAVRGGSAGVPTTAPPTVEREPSTSTEG
jgi:cell division protein FtsQ